jgi:hypothetical protein
MQYRSILKKFRENEMIHLTPGWATFGQALPQGFATTSVQIDGLTTQCDVKTLWPDDSIRFAILTAFVTVEGDYTVVP